MTVRFFSLASYSHAPFQMHHSRFGPLGLIRFQLCGSVPSAPHTMKNLGPVPSQPLTQVFPPRPLASEGPNGENHWVPILELEEKKMPLNIWVRLG